MRQPPKPEWLDESPRPGAPFFSYNALMFVFQLALGIGFWYFFSWFFRLIGLI